MKGQNDLHIRNKIPKRPIYIGNEVAGHFAERHFADRHFSERTFCPLKFLYFRQVVVSAKCLFGEKCVRQTVRSTKCSFDKVSVGKMSVRQNVFRQSVFRQNVRVPGNEKARLV